MRFSGINTYIFLFALITLNLACAQTEMMKNALEQRVNTLPMSIIYNGNGNTGGEVPVNPQLYIKGESVLNSIKL